MQPKKPSAKTSNLRHIRIEGSRKPKTTISSEESMGWAVSYSDMLMVLMSFFVLFFSFEGDQRTDLLARIAVDIDQSHRTKSGQGKDQISEKAQGGISPSKTALPGKYLTGQNNLTGHGGTLSKEEIGYREPKEDPSHWILELSHKLAAESPNLKVLTQENYLVLDFPDNIYPARKFEVDEVLEDKLKNTLSILKPYRENIRISFIGHADSSVLTSTNSYLTNNFDLSALRASRARDYAIRYGFLTEHVSIHGSGSNVRSTRSLSIKIESLGH